MERRLPLEGVRILDLTMAWAGPMAVRILADMGADVIKIEGAGHMDRWRGGTFAQRGTERYPDHDPGPRPWNRSSYANTQNRNKRSLVLDLKHPEGKAIFKRLVPLADIVAENFSAGAMARLGLDYPVLRAIKPDIIMLSMPAFGRTGPEKDYIAHGPTIEEMAGTAFLQGYPDGPPLPSGGLAWGDPIAGIMGAAAALIALAHRRRAGQGQHIDLSHLEAAIPFNFQAVLDYSVNGRTQGRRGNLDTAMVPHGCYPCAGEDRWVVLACRSDEEWRRLCEVIGAHDWGHDPDLATLPGRWRHRTAIDERIAAWTCERDHHAVAALLQRAGIAAGPVLDAAELAQDPHLTARGFFELVTHPEAGTHRYPGMPWKLSRTPGWVRRPAPCFGEHNEEILSELLGLTPSEIDRLYQEGVIAREPLPQGD